MLPGARRALVDLARTILAAEAVGVARECTDLAAEYAKVRQQFGRPIAMFQAVKHHCANMLVATELATAAVWDAARAAAERRRPVLLRRRGRRRARRARRRPVRQPQHPGARRHRLHVGARRATSTCAGPRRSAPSSTPTTPRADVTDLTRAGRAPRAQAIDLPPEAEEIRDEVRAFVDERRRASTSDDRKRAR